LGLDGTETITSSLSAGLKEIGTGLGTASAYNYTDFVPYRTFGSAANSATTDFVAYRTFGSAANSSSTDFEVPLTFSTGLTRTGNTITNPKAHLYLTLSALTGLSLDVPNQILSLTSGYAIPTTTNVSNWNNAYTNMGQVAIDAGTTYPMSGTYFIASGAKVVPKFDSAPVSGGTLPLTSGGVYTAFGGNPSTNGYVLSSTTSGVRTWVVNGSGSYIPLATSSTLGGIMIDDPSLPDATAPTKLAVSLHGNSGVVSLTTVAVKSALGITTLSGSNTGDNATNTTYSSDYRAANFVAGTNYLSPSGSAASLTGFRTINSTALVGSGDFTLAQIAGSTGQSFSANNITLAGVITLPNSCGVNANSSIVKMVNGSYTLNLDASGNVSTAGTITAGNFILSSDKRLKENIIPLNRLSTRTDWTDQIQFVQFSMKSDSTHRPRYGVIAQEVEKVAPGLVYTDAKGMKSVGYTDLLVAKMARMEQIISGLEKRIKILENEKK
jgi:hypothetical protein